MNGFFGSTLISIEAFFKKNNIYWFENRKYSEMIPDEVYVRLLLNFDGRRGFSNNISIFYNIENNPNGDIKDITFLIYVHEYPYIWQYVPTVDEKKILLIYNDDNIETSKMIHKPFINDDNWNKTFKKKQNNDNIETLTTLLFHKFKKIYKQSKEFKKKYKKLKKRIKKNRRNKSRNNWTSIIKF